MNDASHFRRSGEVARSLSPEEREAAERAWLEENAEAIASSNDYVRKHGLPLARYRLF